MSIGIDFLTLWRGEESAVEADVCQKSKSTLRAK